MNDTYGHRAGDELLLQVGQRLQRTLRKSDTVSRLGGDEFTIIVNAMHEPGTAVELAPKVLDALGQPFRLGEATVNITASIGVAVYPEHGQHPELLVQKADAAMYRQRIWGATGLSFMARS